MFASIKLVRRKQLKILFKICLINFFLLSFTFLFSPSLLSNEPSPETPISPSDALKRLMEGNERFTQDKSKCPERNQERRASIVAKQKPFAIVVGCSDSRVPPEIAFDQG